MTAQWVDPDRTSGTGPASEPGWVDDVILGLAAAGVPVRKIAQEVGMPKSTVQDRLSNLLRTRTQRASDEFIAMREVRLEDLFRRAYASLSRAEKGTDAWGRVWDRCLRAEESLRKLKGADAPEALTIALERRVDEESADVNVAVIAAVQAVAAALPDLDGAFRTRLQHYALEVAGRALVTETGGDPGPEPRRLGRNSPCRRARPPDNRTTPRPLRATASRTAWIGCWLNWRSSRTSSAPWRTTMKTDRRKQIKRRLREIARSPGAPGAAEEAQRLTAEYKRLQSAERSPAAEPAPADPDADAIATWPPELRARLHRAAMSRVISPWR